MPHPELTRLLDAVTISRRWAEEGGRLVADRPEAPTWLYLRLDVTVSALSLMRHSATMLVACLEAWESKARESVVAEPPDVPLALDHPYAGWVNADGETFRFDDFSGNYVALYGIPTQAWADAWDARQKAEADATS